LSAIAERNQRRIRHTRLLRTHEQHFVLQLILDRLHLARFPPRSDTCHDPFSRHETRSNLHETHGFLELFTRNEALVVTFTTQQYWTDHRIQTVLGQACDLNLSAGDSVEQILRAMSALAFPRLACSVTIVNCELIQTGNLRLFAL
jgi:hypothetical protein